MSRNDSKNDKIVYFGVININEKGKNIGAIDIWRSAITKELFCEEKRLGNLDIADHIGMPKIDKSYKWAVAVNRNRLGKDRWKLIKIVKEGKFSFYDTDDETIINTNVTNYHINDDNDWWNLLVENNINRSIEITKEL
ncbi:MAG TPA: hypothetical protein VFT83_04855 [Nitrososphaeraceae archaeon]|jgi:hypothetical protein|nr:hypothetical protein [Nitrososphaeraceae archaeon]